MCERMTRRRAAICSSSRHTSMALTIIAGVGRLRSDVKRQAVDLDAQFGRQPQQIRDRFRIAAEFARQIAPARRDCGTRRESAASSGCEI